MVMSGNAGSVGANASNSRSARLDMSDPHQVARLCLEFGCRERHIYIAVAVVGDRLPDVRRYLKRVLLPGPNSAVSDLPPLWSSVLHADAGC